MLSKYLPNKVTDTDGQQIEMAEKFAVNHFF